MSVSRGVSVREFAELNDASEAVVRRQIRDGTIPSYRIGKLLRIPLSYLEQLQRPDAAIDAAIDAIVATAPALTDDQRNRISALLRTGGNGKRNE